YERSGRAEMPRESGYAEVNGTRLHYEVAGTGPALALVHGFTLDCRMWDDQFALLAEQFRVVRYDLRGFGRSALPGAAPYLHADDLRALLDHLDMAPATVVGFSLGGGIAIDFAILHPEATAALVPVDSTLGGVPFSADFRAFLAELGRRARADGLDAAKQLW